MAATFQSQIISKMNQSLPDPGDQMALDAVLDLVQQILPQMDRDSAETRVRAICADPRMSFEIKTISGVEYVVASA